MAVKNISDLHIELNLDVTDNTEKLNTAARVRNIVGDFIDSAINRLDDKALLNLRVFNVGRAYEVGEGVLYDPGSGYQVYRCTTAHSGAWNAGHFAAVNAVVGAAGGDLSGTYPNPAVAKINGVAYNADPLVQYVLLAGRVGGQTIYGGNTASNDLTLKSNSTGTHGSVLIAGISEFDDDGLIVTENVSIGNQAIDTSKTLIVWQEDYEDSAMGIFGNVITEFTTAATSHSVYGYDYGVAITYIDGNNDSIAVGVKTAVNIQTRIADAMAIESKKWIGFWADMGSASSGAGTGTIEDCIKFYAPTSGFNGTAPASSYGMLIEDQGDSGVTDSYGIFIDEQTAATNSYGIVSMAEFNGIRTDSPAYSLEIGDGDLNFTSRGQKIIFAGAGVTIERPTATDSLYLTGSDVFLVSTHASTAVAVQTNSRFTISDLAGTNKVFEANPNTHAIGLYGVTAVIRATTAGAAATFVAGAGTAVNDASTFDGYTLKQIVKALRNIGLLT